MPKLMAPKAHRVSFFPDAAPPRPFSPWALVAFIALSFAAGALGQLLSGPNVPEYYMALQRPPLSPPSWVFAPVWSALYLMMGISAALVWRHRDQPQGRRAIAWWGVQLALNTVWSGLFFGLTSPGLALLEIVVLAGAIVAYMLSARPLDRRAAWLVVPYLAWVGFATYLNAGVWLLNR